MGSKKKPKPSAAQEALQQQQLIQLTELDEEENKRRKLLLSNAAGLRAFKGSALTRATPSNTSPTGVAARPSAFVPRAPSGPASGGGRVFQARSLIS